MARGEAAEVGGLGADLPGVVAVGFTEPADVDPRESTGWWPRADGYAGSFGVPGSSRMYCVRVARTTDHGRAVWPTRAVPRG